MKMKAEWISVEDKLPELNVMVLTYAHCEKKNANVQEVGYRFKMVNCDLTPFSNENSYWAVTHWTPLPKGPKETA